MHGDKFLAGMHLTMIARPVLCLCLLAGLAACGPSGDDNGTDPPIIVDPPPPPDGDTTNYVPLPHQTSSATSDVVMMTVSADTARQIRQGQLDRANDRLTLGGTSGVFSAATLQIDLSDGSRLTIQNLPTGFVERVTLQPASGATQVGIIGVPTAPAGLPDSGQVTYTGTDLARVQVIDGSDAYDLTGNVRITADFTRGEVDITLSALDGQRIGASGTEMLTNVATIRINDASFANGVFSGGTFTITGSELPTSFSSSVIFEMTGQIFGPEADEAGGVLRISDSDFRLVGTFVGD